MQASSVRVAAALLCWGPGSAGDRTQRGPATAGGAKTLPAALDSPGHIADDPPVWLFVGTGTKFEAVPGGRELQRECGKCNRRTVFYERKVTRRVSLYFVDLFAHSPKYIMACGACGAGFAVDHLDDPGFMESQTGTALGVLGSMAGKARAAIEDGSLSQEASRIGGTMSEAASHAKDSVHSWLSKQIDKK